jgi:hypothetical protein
LLPFSSESFVLLPHLEKLKVYRTIIFPAVLYGYDTWSLTLREEHRLRVFVNRVLGSIFGHKRKEVTGGWRGPHNEELHQILLG